MWSIYPQLNTNGLEDIVRIWKDVGFWRRISWVQPRAIYTIFPFKGWKGFSITVLCWILLLECGADVSWYIIEVLLKAHLYFGTLRSGVGREGGYLFQKLRRGLCGASHSKCFQLFGYNLILITISHVR